MEEKNVHADINISQAHERELFHTLRRDILTLRINGKSVKITRKEMIYYEIHMILMAFLTLTFWFYPLRALRFAA